MSPSIEIVNVESLNETVWPGVLPGDADGRSDSGEPLSVWNCIGTASIKDESLFIAQISSLHC